MKTQEKHSSELAAKVAEMTPEDALIYLRGYNDGIEWAKKTAKEHFSK